MNLGGIQGTPQRVMAPSLALEQLCAPEQVPSAAGTQCSPRGSEVDISGALQGGGTSALPGLRLWEEQGAFFGSSLLRQEG